MQDNNFEDMAIKVVFDTSLFREAELDIYPVNGILYIEDCFNG